MLNEFKKYHKISETSFRVKNSDEVIEKVVEKYEVLSKKYDYSDGVSFYFDDWWFNLRKSNTEPLLRLNLETKNPKKMILKKQEVVRVIKKYSK